MSDESTHPPPQTPEQAAIEAAVTDLRLGDTWRYDRSRQSFWAWDGYCWRDQDKHPTHLVDWFNDHRLRIGAAVEGHEDWDIDLNYFEAKKFSPDVRNRHSPLWTALRQHPTIDRPPPNPPRHELNTPDGIVDLRTGKVRLTDPSTSEHRAITAVGYNPHSADGIHRAVLYRVLGRSLSKADCEEYEKLLGLAVSGQAPQHAPILWLYGQSGGGKSMTAELTKDALGEYAEIIESDYLNTYRSGDIDAQLAELIEHQPRLLISTEVTAAKAKKLNALVDGTSHSARKPYGQRIKGRIDAAFWFSTTEMPRLPIHSGIKRRSKFLEYPKNIGGEGGSLPPDQRLNVFEPPRELLEAIIHLGVKAAKAVYQPGYRPPTGNKTTQKEALAEADPIDAWLAALPDDYAGTTLRQAAADYNEQEDAEGKSALNAQWLGRVIRQQERWRIDRVRSGGKRVRVLELQQAKLEEMA